MKRFMEIKSFEILSPSQQSPKLNTRPIKPSENVLSKLAPAESKRKTSHQLDFINDSSSSSEEEPCRLLKNEPYGQLFSQLSSKESVRGESLKKSQTRLDPSIERPSQIPTVKHRLNDPSKSSFSLNKSARKPVQNKKSSLSGQKPRRSGKISSLKARVFFYNQKKEKLEAKIQAKLEEKRERSRKAQQSLFSGSLNAEKSDKFILMQDKSKVQDPPETQSLFDKLNITHEESSTTKNFKGESDPLYFFL